MERLGLGPDVVMRSNPRLIYGRMTGWGQDGPLAKYAGHDIDYIALTGVLAAMGPAPGIPVPPLNVVGDYGGGALYLAMGIAAALFARAHTGRGQMIDAAIIDGASSLLATAMGYCATGQLSWVRGANMLDGSCPYYRCYVCADGKHIAVGAVEPLFYTNLLEKIGVDTEALGPRDDVSRWPAACDILGTLFRTRTRDAWCSLFAETDACVAPVLALHEAPEHGQMRARRVHIEVDGITQPAPAPRFSVDSLALPRGAARVGDLAELRALRRAGGLG
jgi:alpha-methylacyl-CoA racemase